ncbi:MAG: hypothetical protein GVY28_02770, partial [Alphaproteobacteria bacterium]|nr:hypothetical protein [Alphaproteobacteria bacterium]
ATVRNAHATVVVADATHDRRPGTVRLYLEENQMQSARSADLPGQPLFYVAIAEAVLRETVPPGGRILVLALAGGTLATDLEAGGHAVEAVDVNPAAADIARDWFGFDPAAVPVTVADARWFLDHCDRRWDAIFFDVFTGVTAPDHLITREVFAAAGRCLTPSGVVLVNTITPPIQTRPTRRLMAAMVAGLGAPVAVYKGQDMQSWRHNRVMLIRPDGAPPPNPAVDAFPLDLFTRDRRRLDPVVVDAADLAGTPPLTDARNDYALGVARMAEGLSFLPVPASWY